MAAGDGASVSSEECFICLEAGTLQNPLQSRCKGKCKGSQIHESCLRKFKKTNRSIADKCPICRKSQESSNNHDDDNNEVVTEEYELDDFVVEDHESEGDDDFIDDDDDDDDGDDFGESDIPWNPRHRRFTSISPQRSAPYSVPTYISPPRSSSRPRRTPTATSAMSSSSSPTNSGHSSGLRRSSHRRAFVPDQQVIAAVFQPTPLRVKINLYTGADVTPQEISPAQLFLIEAAQWAKRIMPQNQARTFTESLKGYGALSRSRDFFKSHTDEQTAEGAVAFVVNSLHNLL